MTGDDGEIMAPILATESRQQRAFDSRKAPVMTLRCHNPRCRVELGRVCPSDEGLVIVALSQLGKRSTQSKALLVEMKQNGSPLAQSRMSELLILLLADELPRSIRCKCSRDPLPIDYKTIAAGIAAGERVSAI